MNLRERAEEIERLFSEAQRHAALGELTEAAEHGRQGATLCDDQTAALTAGETDECSFVSTHESEKP